MAFDFGNAGLFDPLPTTNSSNLDKRKTNNTKKFDDEDDENDNIHNTNGSWNEDDGNKEGGSGGDDEEVEDWPTAPPLDILDSIKGYEMVSFEQTSVPPPPFEEPTEDEAEGDPAASTGEDPPPNGQKDKTDDNGTEDSSKPKVRIWMPVTHATPRTAASEEEAGIATPASEGESDAASYCPGSLVMRIKLTSIQYKPRRRRLEEESTEDPCPF
jgi:hypothetical protein